MTRSAAGDLQQGGGTDDAVLEPMYHFFDVWRLRFSQIRMQQDYAPERHSAAPLSPNPAADPDVRAWNQSAGNVHLAAFEFF
jgi:hypothetical protein